MRCVNCINKSYNDLLQLVNNSYTSSTLVLYIRDKIKDDALNQRELNYKALKMSTMLECVFCLDNDCVYVSDLIEDKETLLDLELYNYVKLIYDKDSNIVNIQLTDSGEDIKRMMNILKENHKDM